MSESPCPTCGHPFSGADKFCGQCGARLGAAAPAPAAAGGKTMFFAGSQPPGRAKLVMVSAEGADGVAYQLNGTEHGLGRTEGAILLPDDPCISPKHANFVYRNSALFVVDEGSANGVFVRIRGAVTIDSNVYFLLGEQLLQVEVSPPDFGPQPDSEGTYFYSSPKRASKMRLIQRLRGGDIGIIYRARGDTITLGREENDVNFGDDPYVSGHHAELRIAPEGQFTLTDMGSKNGTFIRIAQERKLTHGDYIFVGRQLLRVEIN
jgi:pSer/pThr/pTyr-binding forkhead associated (FHA) protein